MPSLGTDCGRACVAPFVFGDEEEHVQQARYCRRAILSQSPLHDRAFGLYSTRCHRCERRTGTELQQRLLLVRQDPHLQAPWQNMRRLHLLESDIHAIFTGCDNACTIKHKRSQTLWCEVCIPQELTHTLLYETIQLSLAPHTSALEMRCCVHDMAAAVSLDLASERCACTIEDSTNMPAGFRLWAGVFLRIMSAPRTGLTLRSLTMWQANTHGCDPRANRNWLGVCTSALLTRCKAFFMH